MFCQELGNDWHIDSLHHPERGDPSSEDSPLLRNFNELACTKCSGAGISCTNMSPVGQISFMLIYIFIYAPQPMYVLMLLDIQ